jgi:hypothetical protein
MGSPYEAAPPPPGRARGLSGARRYNGTQDRTCNEALPNDGAGYCECSDGTKGYMGCG